MAVLIRALENDPAVNLRRRLITGGAIAAVAVTVLGAWQWASRRRAETEREINRYVEQANREVSTAQARVGDARTLRTQAFAAFDAMDKDAGETHWRQARALLPAIDASYDAAEGSLEAAFMLDQSRRQHRARLADVRYEHFLFAEDFRLGSKAVVLQERIAADREGGRRNSLNTPGTLKLKTTPAASEIALERFERDPLTGRRTVQPAGTIAGATTSLAAGSYRLVASGTGRAQVVYPFEVRRGEEVAVELALPPISAVPEGFVYVPPGEFWFGDADEQVRTQFLGTVPIHRRHTEGYSIARHETTYAEWIAFLDALPPPERARYVPHASATRGGGSMRLQPAGGDGGDRQWQLVSQPTSHRYSARFGEAINYIGRHDRARQDWSRLPVVGIEPADVMRYLEWLRATKRVPGARLCTEVEWERAARGADDRLFPHGDELRPEEANFDQTYRRVDSAYGPDAVGSYPSSRSPFGVDDMAGNAFEFVASSQKADEIVIRGGAYYYTAYTCRSTNREPVARTYRDMTTGIRVCAS
jgi:formylglycine-generating enzyme required for sulfatase activity